METNRSMYDKEMCEKIIDVLNTQLLTDFSFLSKVIYRLEYRQSEKPLQSKRSVFAVVPSMFSKKGGREGAPLQVDGKTIYYDPKWLVDEYRKDTKAVGRLLLHCYLHCLYGHCFPKIGYNQEAWDLCCDVFVEASICRMNHPDYPISEENATWIRYWVEKGLIGIPSGPPMANPLDELHRIKLPHTAKLLYAALEREVYFELFMLQYQLDVDQYLDPLLDNHELWYVSSLAGEELPVFVVDYTENDNAVLEGEVYMKQESDNAEGISKDTFEEEGDSQGEEFSESSGEEGDSQGEESSESSDEGSGSQSEESSESSDEETDSQSEESSESSSEEGDSQGEESSESSDEGSDSQSEESSESSGEEGDSQGEESSESSSEEGDSQGEESSEFSDEESGSQSEESSDASESEEPNFDLSNQQRRKDLQEEWKQVAAEVCQELEQNPNQYGEGIDDLLETLKSSTRTNYDYATFLRRFMVLKEEMQVNLDEFDYIYYTYGLDLYGDIPLIEPLEFQEVYRVEEMVIVIDTSGSVSTETVKAFLKSTYKILTKQSVFGKKFNVHIIQCDDIVHESVAITNQREFEVYIQDFQLKGGGGTDFRPAFNHVEELIHQKAFQHLKGLIYFSDGWGIFPQRPTEYETIFVFVCDQDYQNKDVPYWVTKILLDSEEIHDLMTGEDI